LLSRWVVNFCSPKSGLRTEMTNGILYMSSCMKSSLFVAFMIKFRQDFTEYKFSENPMKTLHFSPLVLFLLHYVRIREGHRTSRYSFVKFWRTKFMLLLRPEELWYHKSSLLQGRLWHRHFKVYGVLYEKMRFSTNNSKAQIPWNSHGSKNEFIMKQEQHQRRKM
jgi:hypothetical protein